MRRSRTLSASNQVKSIGREAEEVEEEVAVEREEKVLGKALTNGGVSALGI